MALINGVAATATIHLKWCAGEIEQTHIKCWEGKKATIRWWIERKIWKRNKTIAAHRWGYPHRISCVFFFFVFVYLAAATLLLQSYTPHQYAIELDAIARCTNLFLFLPKIFSKQTEYTGTHPLLVRLSDWSVQTNQYFGKCLFYIRANSHTHTHAFAYACRAANHTFRLFDRNQVCDEQNENIKQNSSQIRTGDIQWRQRCWCWSGVREICISKTGDYRAS